MPPRSSPTECDDCLVRDTRAVHAALRYKASDILDVEQVQRDKLKSNQVKW